MNANLQQPYTFVFSASQKNASIKVIHPLKINHFSKFLLSDVDW
jgi:hypothetical protein